MTVFPHDVDADELARLRRRAALERARAIPSRSTREIATMRDLLGRTNVIGHLPRPPAARARHRPRDVQAPVRPPRREPSGAAARRRPRARHLAEPRLRGRARATRPRRRTSRSTTAPSRGCRSRSCARARSSSIPRPARARTTRGRCSRGGWTSLPRRDRPPIDLPRRLGADRDRTGGRVRLRGLPGAEGAARGRLPHDRRQLEPGDDHDRPRVRRPHVSRAARPRRRARTCSGASGRTRCCRRWAARPRSTSRASSPRRACSPSSGSS